MVVKRFYVLFGLICFLLEDGGKGVVFSISESGVVRFLGRVGWRSSYYRIDVF